MTSHACQLLEIKTWVMKPEAKKRMNEMFNERYNSTDPCVTSPYEFNERSTFGRFDRYKMQFSIVISLNVARWDHLRLPTLAI